MGSSVAHAVGDWRWGVRTTPFLSLIALVILVFFLTDPPRGTRLISITYSDIEEKKVARAWFT